MEKNMKKGIKTRRSLLFKMSLISSVLLFVAMFILAYMSTRSLRISSKNTAIMMGENKLF
jgi:hypothetical protein